MNITPRESQSHTAGGRVVVSGHRPSRRRRPVAAARSLADTGIAVTAPTTDLFLMAERDIPSFRRGEPTCWSSGVNCSLSRTTFSSGDALRRLLGSSAWPISRQLLKSTVPKASVLGSDRHVGAPTNRRTTVLRWAIPRMSWSLPRKHRAGDRRNLPAAGGVQEQQATLVALVSNLSGRARYAPKVYDFEERHRRRRFNAADLRHKHHALLRGREESRAVSVRRSRPCP
jgi:hypothetical protein